MMIKPKFKIKTALLLMTVVAIAVFAWTYRRVANERIPFHVSEQAVPDLIRIESITNELALQMTLEAIPDSELPERLRSDTRDLDWLIGGLDVSVEPDSRDILIQLTSNQATQRQLQRIADELVNSQLEITKARDAMMKMYRQSKHMADTASQVRKMSPSPLMHRYQRWRRIGISPEPNQEPQ